MPLPDDIAFPVNLDEDIIQQTMLTDLLVVNILMAQDQSIATLSLCLHARNVVTNRVTLSLVVMVLTSDPSLVAIIIYELFLIEFPYYFTIPVNLYNIGLVLITEFRITKS